MKIGLRIYKEFEKGPEIEFLASCRKCKYLDYYEYNGDDENIAYIERAKCLKNNQYIYNSMTDEYRIYEHEMPIWCPLIDGEKLEKITNDINSIEIND